MDESDLEALQPDLERMLPGRDDDRQRLNAKLWQRRDSIIEPRRYALRAAKRCRAECWRSPSRAPASFDEAKGLVDRSLSPLDELIKKENFSRLRRAIDSLPRREREAALAFLRPDRCEALTRAERKALCGARKKIWYELSGHQPSRWTT